MLFDSLSIAFACLIVKSLPPYNGGHLLDKRDSIMAHSVLAPGAKIKKNCRLKIFPNGTVGEILACSMACFVPDGWEAVEGDKPIFCGSAGDGGERARRRAKRRVADLIQCNGDMDVFWTLTLSPDAVTESGTRIARTDYAAVNKKLQQWLADRVRRRGLKYVAVYEYHDRLEQDGKRALHVHGVANHSALNLTDSGRKYKDKLGHWHKIYNVSDWKLGITTAMYLYGDRNAAINYICKYIYKSDEPVGGRWYMHSHNLLEPTYEYVNIDFRAAPGRAFLVPEAHCSFKFISPEILGELPIE